MKILKSYLLQLLDHFSKFDEEAFTADVSIDDVRIPLKKIHNLRQKSKTCHTCLSDLLLILPSTLATDCHLKP